MPNKYYSINPSTNTIVEIKNALIDKYLAGVTIYYQDIRYLIFSCGALSDKIIKIDNDTSRINIFYGDAYVSSSTISNQIKAVGHSSGATIYINLILGDSFLLFSYNQGTSLLNCIAVIAKLTNGKSCILSYTGSSSTISYPSYKCINITDSVELYIINFNYGFASGTGKLYKQPIILQRVDGKVEEDEAGTIATINGLFNISYGMANNADIIGSSYLITASNLNSNIAKYILLTSLFAEF